MDYEKSYKEALERARELYNLLIKEGTLSTPKGIETIFPELKESEDEKIRKSLIRNFTNQHSSNFPTVDGFTREQILAWLEKQGEQNHSNKVEPKFKIGDTVTVKPMSCHGKVFKGEPFKIVDIIEDNYVSDDGKTYSISLQDGWELVEQKPAWLEKQGEKESKGIDFADWDILNYIKDIVREHVKRDEEFNEIDNWLTTHYQEQKPAWSEEDGKIISKLIKHFEWKDTGYRFTKEDCLEATNWLKSLKPQNSQELTEADEEDLKQAAEYLRKHATYIQGGNSKRYVLDLADRIESLKPRWKPTEEQMEALTIAVHDSHESCYYKNLYSLYNDLKSL